MSALDVKSRPPSAVTGAGSTTTNANLKGYTGKTSRAGSVAGGSDAALTASTNTAPNSVRDNIGAGGAEVEDEEALRSMHSQLSKALDAEEGGGAVVQAARLPTLPLPPVWVSKWVDYSKKYGLGYRLSNGNYGVFFNDSDATKVLVDQRAGCDGFEYMERVRGEEGLKRDVLKPCNFLSAPKELAKKVTLTEHFQSYLEQGGGGSQRACGAEDGEKRGEGGNSGAGVYVRKWMRTRHSVIFRLSDNSVQVAFLDETELVLWESRRWVTYKSKGRARATYDVKDAAVMPEIAKRLKYVKDILAQLVAPAQ
eukprot:2565653-Rhodomonas_salina.1